MSWFRQIKILYAFRVLIFMYIIWNFLTEIIFGSFFDYNLFIISIGAALIVQFLKEREFGMTKTLIVSTFIGGFVFGFFTRKDPKYLVLAIIYYAFMGYLIYKMDDEEIDYDNYVYRAKRVVYILCGLGLLLLFNHNNQLRFTIERFMIFYIIMVVATLRESREYKYSKRSTREILESIGAAAIVVILSLDSVFNLIKNVLFTGVRYLAGFISYIFPNVIRFITYLIGHLLQGLIGIMKNLLNGRPIMEHIANQNQRNNTAMLKALPEKNFKIPESVEYVLGVLILLLIMYIILKNMMFENLKRQTEYQEETIEREKITKTDRTGKGVFSDFLKKLFYGSDIRKEIFALYRDFEKRMNSKNIFKSYMTASQLSTAASLNVKDKNPLDRIANIYNESKFSKHDIKKQQLENMKSSLYEVKKEL